MTNNQPTQKSTTIAIACILTACAFVASTTLIAKALGNGSSGEAFHPFQVSAGRFFFAFLALLPFAAIFKPKFKNIAWKVHIGRSLSGWAGVSCLFAAAALMPVAEATAISFLNPMVAMLLAIPFLGEKVGPWRWIAAAISLSGALILIQPGTDAFQFAALIALSGALFMGIEVIFIKKLTGNDSPLQILLINNFIGATIACSVASSVFVTPNETQLILMGALGCLMVTAQFFFIQAMKRSEASFIMPFFYGTLVFAAIYDFVIFNVIPEWVSIAGAGLIISGAVILAWREGRHKKAT
ncbi:DMT family transporter [Curvivirga aplysinae]|uniref:DMT family transporter n=1 Tax=Curvivirga aplysinae TaxID=2529852 RepID=UPI0012BC5173|nr:DMT family transporter [Curvivirga aplysinae]MTI10451.1 DMT family transporter [Curvivirga aplysinae]